MKSKICIMIIIFIKEHRHHPENCQLRYNTVFVKISFYTYCVNLIFPKDNRSSLVHAFLCQKEIVKIRIMKTK